MTTIVLAEEERDRLVAFIILPPLALFFVALSHNNKGIQRVHSRIRKITHNTVVNHLTKKILHAAGDENENEEGFVREEDVSGVDDNSGVVAMAEELLLLNSVVLLLVLLLLFAIDTVAALFLPTTLSFLWRGNKDMLFNERMICAHSYW